MKVKARGWEALRVSRTRRPAWSNEWVVSWEFGRKIEGRVRG